MGRERESSWVGLLALFSIAGLVEAGFWNQLNVFTPLYLPQIGVRPEDVPQWTGALASIAGLIGLPFLPFWGALADRYARQPVIVRSFVAHLLSGVLALLAGNIWVYLIARSVQSFSLGNSGLMMTTLSERTPQGKIGLAFGIMNGSSPLGAFLGPLAGGPVVDRWGFPVLLAINIVLLAGITLAMALGYKDNYRGTARGSLASMAFDSVGIIWRSRRLRALFPALFLLFSGWMLAFAYVSLVVKEIYHGPDVGTATGIVAGVGGLVTLVVSPAIGALADRIGHWRMLFISSILTVLLWPLPIFTSDLTGFIVAWAAINGVSSGVFALSFSVMANSAPSDVRGRVMSFAYLPANAAIILGSAVGSVVTRGGVFGIFPVAAVLTAAGVLALLVAARQPDTAQQAAPALTA